MDLGPYRPEQLIANGTRTQVWAAVGPDGVAAAVKVARGEEHRPALLREASITRKLDTPGVPRFLDADEGGRWLAMERVSGIPIDKWARQAREKTLAEVGVQLLEVLHHLHSQGVVHGDIKPANVLIDDAGRPILVDFGSATFLDKPTKGFRGTLGFVAPEILEGRAPTPASDLYGFGALLYACLTDRPPFVLPDPAALAYVPTVSLPAPPSTWVPGISQRVDHLVMQLLAHNPARRPGDLRAVSQALLNAPNSALARRVLGMEEARDRLRRAVVDASKGACRAVVVYGPPGSGRLTLITEAVEAAVREGLLYLPGITPNAAETAIAELDGPPVLVFRKRQRNAQTVTEQILQAGRPALILVHSDRPLPRLTAVGVEQMTPPPLDRTEASQLVASLGGDMGMAEAWRDACHGLPIGIIGRCRAWLRERSGDPPDLDALPARSRRILQILRDEGELSLVDLAKKARMKEMALLDHCEVLLAEALVVPTQGGAALAPTRDDAPPADETPTLSPQPVEA